MAESIKPVSSKHKIIFVVGPTASGKSAWALENAEKYQGSVINIDSIQFYEKLIVGSAAPSPAEKARAPHYLYSYVKAPEEMTAGRYLQEFYQLLEDPKLKFPLFVVGGTGFYIQALEKGMYDVEPIPAGFKQAIEDELAEQGAERLYQELKEKDPNTKIHLNDHYRIVRAIEIIRYTGKVPSQMQDRPLENKNHLQVPFIKIGFSHEKEVLLKIVHGRAKQMIKCGIIDETKYFLEQGFDQWAPLASVGYKETAQFLKDGLSEKWLQDSIEQSTMRLIKKQKTWFKRDPSILWSDRSAQTLLSLGLKLDQFLIDD